MKKIILLFSLLPLVVNLEAQQVKVPSKMEFAGIKLRILEDAREEIQKDVDALTASPKYYEIKAERARTYFPIIERIFKEENLPEDFKYLCLQESALIADAVSTSNAVGYWQFKDFTAVEVGMRVDKTVDERMNIVSSTRGAARYLHKNNQHFDNWLHTLQSYQMGAGGAMKVLGNGMEGAKAMTVSSKTYWYVKKYLAHKIAFEGAFNKAAAIQVSEYYNGAGKSLKDVAQEVGLSETELAEYNKWLKKGKIPDDKTYAVVIPQPALATAVMAREEPQPAKKEVTYEFDKPGDFPKIEDKIDAMAGKIVDINSLPGIIAGKTDRIPELAKKADISLSKFLKYNDLGIDGRLIAGQVYYMKSKRNKAKAYYHVAEEGESYWSVSQKFGIKLKKLKLKNRVKGNEPLEVGRVLWLRYIRPASVPIEYKEVTKAALPAIMERESIPKERDLVDSMKVEKLTMPDSLKSEKVMSIEYPNEDETTPIIAMEEEEQSVEEPSLEIEEEIEETDEVNEIPKSIKIHEVKMGETYYAISKLYNVAVLDLLAWNELKISDKLSIGQKLKVVVAEQVINEQREKATASEVHYHEVVQGDSLFKIANIYGTTIQQIMEWNNLESTSISMGQKLIIKTQNVEK